MAEIEKDLERFRRRQEIQRRVSLDWLLLLWRLRQRLQRPHFWTFRSAVESWRRRKCLLMCGLVDAAGAAEEGL